MPYFSIIIPTFNSEATLHKCIASIITQTFKDYEVLIIDGVSDDNTLSIVSEFNDPRIKIISEPDKGIYDAMNKGIKLAKGEWLFFLGSDDKFYDTKVLEDVLNNIEDNNISIIYGNVIFKNNGYIYDGQFTVDKLQTKNICHQAIFYNKRVFDKLGYFNVKYKALADYDFNLKWFFSSQLKSVYFDRIISVFDPRGYSSIYQDQDFVNDKASKLLRLGWSSIKVSDLKNICVHDAKLKFESHKYFDFILKKTIYYILRVIDFYLKIILKLRELKDHYNLL